MNTRPSLSILVSTYNWKEALQCCVSSILRQTIPPDEILIADDGSRQDTTNLINSLAATSPVPIIHVWQEDTGFNRCSILNKAIATGSCDYIIEVDGDIILEPHFIADHLNASQHGFFVCGSRVCLSKEQTTTITAHPDATPAIHSSSLNALRCRPLSKLLERLYGRDIFYMRGCNFAFWRNDFIKVNGYNENIYGWGREDSELAYRLHFSGIKKKFLKFGGVCYHLHHNEASRNRDNSNMNILRQTISSQSQHCQNGIDKYLNH